MAEQLLTVNEIFYSLQGESSYAGRPCSFVRLTFCNLRCAWCDTEYAFEEGRPMRVQEVVQEVQKHPTELVEITGGEPLLQPAVYPLISILLDQGRQVLIETGGSLSVERVDPRAILIYDIKCPDSGMEPRNHWENLGRLKAQDEIKFVIASRRDYEWAREVLQERRLNERHTVLFSPVWGRLPAQELAEWILHDGLPVRLQLQLHKILWGPDRRGV